MFTIYKLFLISLLSGIAIIPWLISFSKKTGKILDISEGDALKIHQQPVPLLGGLAMLVAAFIGLSFFIDSKIIFLALGTLVIFALGFWDDVKWKHVSTIKPLLKFALLMACSLGAAAMLLPIGISFILASIYIFICINAVNYQDGMDGLAGGLTGISLLGFVALALFSGNTIALGFSLVFLGATTAFLVFNLPPAKIFMGDSGAYMLGFVLATLACMFLQPYSWQSIIGPIFIIGQPIFDGVFTNIRRLARGHSIFHGDRSHFYDRLLQKGFSAKKTLAICYGLQLALVAAGLLIFH